MLFICVNPYPATDGNSKTATLMPMSIPLTHAKCKGNYSECAHWPISHYKRGKRLFELIFIDFITMPNSKGKHYILTILDCFNQHFTVLPCARDCAINVAHGLYQFFLCHREMPHIVSSNHCTQFTDKQFCSQMSIIPELYCPERPQSSGNIEQQHRTMKNALYVLCEDRNRE